MRVSKKRLRQLPGLLDWWQRLSRSEWLSDSETSLDDRSTAWRHLSAGVRYSLDLAADNLRVVHKLIVDDAAGPLPFVATYPLTRSALEGAATGLWVLAPSDHRVRISRHLRNAVRELHDEASLRKFALRVATEQPKELGLSGSVIGREQLSYRRWWSHHRTQIEKCAARLSLEDPFKARRVGYAEIVGEAAVATNTPAAYGEILWRQISGLTHPSLVRASSTLLMDERGENADGTARVMMSSKLETVHLGVVLALLRFKTALGAYQVRIEQKADPSAYGSVEA